MAQSKQQIDKMIALMRAADTADPPPEVVKQIDEFIRSDPQLWRAAGDMVEQAARHLIASINVDSFALRRSLAAGWEQLPRTLSRPGDGELEHLLVQQVVIAWLYLGYIEWQYSALLTSSDITIKRGDYWERRMNTAQRRYLRATETLARVRRLQLPAMQVNIGAQQVNQIT